MLTLKDFMEIINYRITDGDSFGWPCFGDNSYTLSAWNGEQDGWSCNITFNNQTQEVFLVEVCDYKNDRAYRLINPDWATAFRKHGEEECPGYANQAWDDVDYVDLETDEDWTEKARAIVAGEDYDTRVSVPIDFSDEELLKYMTLAHERDMTFNQLVEQALREAIDEFKRDPESMKQRAESWKREKNIL